jgi:hypothetical protein
LEALTSSLLVVIAIVRIDLTKLMISGDTEKLAEGVQILAEVA